MQGPSIDFENVCLALGNTSILQDVSFSVRAGSLHCIVGANGGGKTSLVRSLLGQMPHTGHIRITWHEGKVIGYVPQSLDFDKSLPITVLDFMAMTLQRRPVFFGVNPVRRKAITEVLERLGLKDQLRKPLGGLSGGERQRVLLAQALLPDPALLVLDEPMTGLDLAGRDILERTIRQFVSNGGTAVWINHDIVQVNAIADALTYINRTVLLNGPPREVLGSGVAAHLFPTLSLEGNEAARA
jgi:zinc transport system ATP-binding protein